ncbi:cell division protein ZapE [Pseudidiomarina sediminum]|uniref:Cell division protein ZapE n=1 Tax=Pseudidiomarina sediminum TaxID=431675 RepID=A0A432Z2S0_9GAMM|nr:cell division protein ZapE [Pseudidiomarina sediminum]RUO72175.1 cell division protein ZapE [Pseudidiomarina sediminum]
MTSNLTNLSPAAAYQHALSEGFHVDAAQQHAVDCLEQCFQALQRGDPKVPGVYLWGPVGRGKTWLMDVFCQSLSVPAKRQHFHHFMRWLHRRLFQLTGQEAPLQLLATELSESVRVLCLDEFFVNDIGDAVLLGGFMQHLFATGTVLVTTSNQPPDELYKDGFNRERLLPAIAAMNAQMQVVSVDGGQDHRLHPGKEQQRYWVQQPAALQQTFLQLTTDQQRSTTPFALAHIELPVVQRTAHTLWFRYADVCEQPLGAMDFVELCDAAQHIFLSEVPQLSAPATMPAVARGTEDGAAHVLAGDRTLPTLSRNDDGVRRFIALVDECYDRRIPLYIDAAVPLTELYTEGALAFPFRRTLSRLNEMQRARFGR